MNEYFAAMCGQRMARQFTTTFSVIPKDSKFSKLHGFYHQKCEVTDSTWNGSSGGILYNLPWHFQQNRSPIQQEVNQTRAWPRSYINRRYSVLRQARL